LINSYDTLYDGEYKYALKINRKDVQQYQETNSSMQLDFLLLLFWHAPLGVCITKRRHQSPYWMILSHISCFIQGEVVGFQVLLDSLHPHSTSASWWSPPVHQGEAVKIFLESVSSGIHAIWPKGEMPCLDN